MITLNQEQLAATQATGKNVLVIGSPGSGKTRCIVERVAWLMETQKVSPHELMLITFTRLAAQEMRKRIEVRVGLQAHKITIGTFHSIALNLFHRFGDLIGYKAKNITVYGEWEEDYLIREIAFDLGIYNGKSWKVKRGDINGMLNAYYSRGEEPKKEHPGYVLFRDLLARCRENQGMTYGGLLIGMKLLLPHIQKYLSWKHIIVDEAHDNNSLQWDLVLELQKLLDASLCIITDLDQAIYKWRGSSPEWILDHQDQFDIYPLETNYRSISKVVNSANRLIQNNTQRIEKQMFPSRESGDPIEIVNEAESTTIANLIANIIAGGIAPGDIAVLSRIHVLLEKIAERLDGLGVPYKKVGRKTEAINTEEFRRFHSVLKLIVNPYDNFSFLLIKDIIGLTRGHYNNIRLLSSGSGLSHFQTWREETEWTLFFRTASHHDLPSLLDKMNNLNFGFDVAPIIAFIMAWCADNPGIKHTACDEGPLQNYLSWLATWDIQEEIEESSECVQLMTVHAAKGLEFPVVLIAGCNEGILPSKQAIASGDIEEERRIFYVGMTRAEDHLILCIRPNSEHFANPVSRFIGELENGWIQRISVD